MNRHERRAQRATASKLSDDPEYVRVIEGIVYAFHVGLRTRPPSEKPRFAMPPKEVLVIVSLDVIAHRLARNDAAQYFLQGIIEGARRSGDMKKMPTLFMLRVALENLGSEVIVEEASLAELGISAGGHVN